MTTDHHPINEPPVLCQVPDLGGGDKSKDEAGEREEAKQGEIKEKCAPAAASSHLLSVMRASSA